MAANSKISWTTHTLNPWRGCQHAVLDDGTEHPGCGPCYAEAMSKRNQALLGKWGPNGTRIMASDVQWKAPLKWNREAEAAGERARVFCASIADVFEDWQGPIHDHRGNVAIKRESCLKHDPITMDDLRRDLFALIDQTPSLDWLLLTKRPENIPRMWPSADVFDSASKEKAYWPNIWLGTSISNQHTADKFIPELLKCRDLAPVLFLSAEPLLGRIVLHPHIDAAKGFVNSQGVNCDQVIIGVESSGPRLGSLGDFKSEREWLDAAVDLVGQCRDAGVAAFVKQIPLNGKLVHDLDEMPEALQVRQFPNLESASV